MSKPFAASLINTVPSAHGLLSRRAYFLHWGVVQISLTNFVIIVLMVVLFVLPGGKAVESEEDRGEQ
jgi:large-conductance mechanosensitive channel